MIDYGTFEKKKTYGNENNFLKLFFSQIKGALPCHSKKVFNKP